MPFPRRKQLQTDELELPLLANSSMVLEADMGESAAAARAEALVANQALLHSTGLALFCAGAVLFGVIVNAFPSGWTNSADALFGWLFALYALLQVRVSHLSKASPRMIWSTPTTRPRV